MSKLRQKELNLFATVSALALRATITKYQEVGGLKAEIYFVTILEARSVRSGC